MPASIKTPILIFLLALALLSVGLSSKQAFHSDEMYYLQASREMRASGDYITPTFNGAKRFQKPILYYWLVSGSYASFGDSIVAGRLASTLVASLALTLIFLSLLQIFGGLIAWLSFMAILSTFGFYLHSHYAMTDMTLTSFIAMGLLLYWLRENSRGDPTWMTWGMFLFFGLACLTKGPLGIAIPAVTIAIYAILTRRLNALRPFASLSGWWIFIVVVLPWFLMMYQLHGSEYSSYFFSSEIQTRTWDNHEPGYLLVALLVYILPWTIFVPLPFLKWRSVLKNRNALFPLAWIISPLIIFAFIPNQHAHYVLPCVIPACILLMSLYAKECSEELYKGFRKWSAIALMIMGGVFGVVLLTSLPLFENPWPLAVHPIIFIVGGIILLLPTFKKESLFAVFVVGGVFLLTLYWVNIVTIPSMTKRPEDHWAKTLHTNPDLKIVTFKYRTKRLKYVLPYKTFKRTWDQEELADYVKKEGDENLYFILDKSEWGNIPESVRSHFNIIDTQPYWRKVSRIPPALKRLLKRDHEYFKRELLLAHYLR